MGNKAVFPGQEIKDTVFTKRIGLLVGNLTGCYDFLRIV